VMTVAVAARRSRAASSVRSGEQGSILGVSDRVSHGVEFETGAMKLPEIRRDSGAATRIPAVDGCRNTHTRLVNVIGTCNRHVSPKFAYTRTGRPHWYRLCYLTTHAAQRERSEENKR
jgi:hypothetical protein